MHIRPWMLGFLISICCLTLACALRLSVSQGPKASDENDSMMTRRLRRAAGGCNVGDCMNGGICYNITFHMSGYIAAMCLCPLPYTDEFCTSMINYCSTAQPEKGIDPPSAPPCLNGGTCTGTIVTDPYFSCSCVPGFTGSRCEINIAECIGNTCINGQCRDLVNSCVCYRGWEGRNCSVDRDDCVTNACANGGKCVDGNSTTTCDCSATDYAGVKCTTWIDDCAINPCQNGGRCADGVRSYSCDCSDTGFKGTHCEVNVDDCAPNPCLNGAACVDGVKDFSCTCLSGYSGKTCSVDFLDCAPHRCDNDGFCLERSNPDLYGRPDLPAPFNGTFSYSLAAGFVCVCPHGVYGPTCSTNPNDCLSPSTNLSVCVHASGCTDHLNDFTCHCLPGYDGRDCSNDINECQVSGPPCQNGGTCTDLVADYQCTCTAGFGGKNCSFTTLVSFNGSNSLAVLLGNSLSVGNWTLELTFRSSLIDFDLLAISSDWGFIRIGALNSSLIVQLWNSSSLLSTSSPIGQVSWPIAAQLDSADWLTVSIVLTNGSATLTPIGSSVSQSEKSIDGLAGKFKPSQLSVHIGGEGVSTIEGGRFRGCVRDLRLVTGSSTSVAMETTVKSDTATWGVCNRSPQCSGLSPCQSSSSLTCSDLWNDFVCHCQPSFGGPTCSVQLPSFTLGLAGNVSSATFTSLPAASSVYGNDPHWTIEFSVVTMSPGAFLLLLGDFRDSATTPRLLAVVEPTGRLSAQLLHSNGTQIGRVESPASVAIGSSVYVRIFVSTSRGLLSLTTSSTVTSSSFSRQSSQLSGDLIIGGFSGAAAAPAPVPVSGGRAKRSAAALASSLTSSLPANVTGFRGILSSPRLHEITPLLLGSVGASLIDSLPGALSASDSSGVVTGTGTEKVCAVHAPCKNGGTCSDDFYNSYTCDCSATDFEGPNCSSWINNCQPLNLCQNGGSCVDGVRSHRCSCLSGYSGSDCAVDFADCSPNPCEPTGVCLERSVPGLYNSSYLPWPFNGSFSHSLAAGFVCFSSQSPVGMKANVAAAIAAVSGAAFAFTVSGLVAVLLVHQYRQDKLPRCIRQKPPQNEYMEPDHSTIPNSTGSSPNISAGSNVDVGPFPYDRPTGQQHYDAPVGQHVYLEADVFLATPSTHTAVAAGTSTFTEPSDVTEGAYDEPTTAAAEAAANNDGGYANADAGVCAGTAAAQNPAFVAGFSTTFGPVDNANNDSEYDQLEENYA